MMVCFSYGGSIYGLFLFLQVYEILARTVYGKRKRAEVGVDRLVNEGAYTAAFPLHEVRNSALFGKQICCSLPFLIGSLSISYRALFSFLSRRSVLTS